MSQSLLSYSYFYFAKYVINLSMCFILRFCLSKIIDSKSSTSDSKYTSNLRSWFLELFLRQITKQSKTHVYSQLSNFFVFWLTKKQDAEIYEKSRVPTIHQRKMAQAAKKLVDEMKSLLKYHLKKRSTKVQKTKY